MSGDAGDAVARLRAQLAARGLPWPAEIEHTPLSPSTNDRLKQRARAGAAEWTVVLADAQTAGRGRQGKRWSSPPGNLYLSVLLRPAPPGARWGVLPLAAGLGYLFFGGEMKWFMTAAVITLTLRLTYRPFTFIQR